MTGIILMISGAILLLTGIAVFIGSSKGIRQTELTTKLDNPAELAVIKTNKQPIADNEFEHLVELAIADGVLTKNEKDSLRKIANEKSLDYDQIIIEIQKKLELNIEAETALIDKEKKNGDDFEKFIVQKFDKSYFKIKEWAGDKYVNGIYAETTQNPDILFEFKLKDESRLFSVECKWRKNLYMNRVEFANESQLARYRKFETEKNIPVFVAIGIGGEASDPEHLYIIPLKNISNTFLTISTLVN